MCNVQRPSNVHHAECQVFILWKPGVSFIHCIEYCKYRERVIYHGLSFSISVSLFIRLRFRHPVRFCSTGNRQQKNEVVTSSTRDDAEDQPDWSLWKAPFAFDRIRKFLLYDENIDSVGTDHRDFELMTTSEYITNGLKAQNARFKKDKVVDGVYGVCAYCLQPQFDLTTHCSFDKAHCLSGICKSFIYCLAGLRGNVTDTVVKLSVGRGFYGGLITKTKERPPWRVKKSNHAIIELYAQCIIYPSSMRSDYRFDHFMTKPKNLHIDDVLKLCMVALPYCVSKCHEIPIEYKLLYYTLCDYIVQSLVTIVDTTAMDELYQKIVEFLAISQAMLPKSECIFLKHEWCHVPHSLAVMGPYISNNALAQERFLALFKRWVPRGGRNYNLTMSNSLLRFEQSCDEQFILGKDFVNNNNGSDGFDILSLYPTHLISSSKKDGASINLNNQELHDLIQTILIYEIERAQRLTQFQHLCNRSSLVRLYCLYCWWKELLQKVNKETIISYFERNNAVDVALNVFLTITMDCTNIMTWISLITTGNNALVCTLLAKWTEICITKVKCSQGSWLNFDCFQYVCRSTVLTEDDHQVVTDYVRRDLLKAWQFYLNKPCFRIEHMFSEAIVYGCHMISRKELHSIANKTPQEDLYHVRTEWDEQSNINSWVYVTESVFDPSAKCFATTSRHMFGMLNYFLEIDSTVLSIHDRPDPSEKYLLASLFVLQSEVSPDCKYLHRIDLSKTSIIRQKFCLIHDIECTRIALSFSDENEKPFLLHSETADSLAVQHLSHENRHHVKYIEPHWLSPHKFCVRKSLKESKLV